MEFAHLHRARGCRHRRVLYALLLITLAPWSAASATGEGRGRIHGVIGLSTLGTARAASPPLIQTPGVLSERTQSRS
jgi:hypothetical protein